MIATAGQAHIWETHEEIDGERNEIQHKQNTLFPRSHKIRSAMPCAEYEKQGRLGKYMYKTLRTATPRATTLGGDRRPQPSEAQGIVLWKASRISDHTSGA